MGSLAGSGRCAVNSYVFLLFEDLNSIHISSCLLENKVCSYLNMTDKLQKIVSGVTGRLIIIFLGKSFFQFFEFIPEEPEFLHQGFIFFCEFGDNH